MEKQRITHYYPIVKSEPNCFLTLIWSIHKLITLIESLHALSRTLGLTLGLKVNYILLFFPKY